MRRTEVHLAKLVLKELIHLGFGGLANFIGDMSEKLQHTLATAVSERR